MSLLAYWVHTPHPFLIQFNDRFGIRWYGLAYLLGFVAGWWLMQRYHRAGRSALKSEDITDLMLALVVGVIAGGRLGYAILYRPQMFAEPFSLFRVWEGGMASHGGFAGVALALGWFSWSRKIPFLHLADVVASTVPAGLLFGRLANFINGELWGKVTTVPWAMIFSATGGGDEPRHPSQLYEAGLEGALLLAFVQWRFWRTDAVRRHPGRLTGEFLLAYAVVRAICEVFREPDADLLFGLSRGTFYSIFLVAGGIAFIVASRGSPSPRE